MSPLIRSLAAALILALILVVAARADEGEGEPEKPVPKAKPTGAQLLARLKTNKITVDWKDENCLDALNEVQTKAGVKFIFDQALADFAGKRKVTFDGYSVPADEALGKIQGACGFTIDPDESEGALALKLDPSAAARAALGEKRMKVAWKEALVSTAIADIEKKTGIKVQLHETIKSRMKSRRITWDSDNASAREAIETLTALPPPAIPARIDPQPGMVVRIVYTGPAENKADIDFFLEEKRLSLNFDKVDLAEAAAFVREATGLPIEVDKKLAAEGKTVTLKESGLSPRAVLDRFAKDAGCAWKIEGGKKIVLRPLDAKK